MKAMEELKFIDKLFSAIILNLLLFLWFIKLSFGSKLNYWLQCVRKCYKSYGQAVTYLDEGLRKVSPGVCERHRILDWAWASGYPMGVTCYVTALLGFFVPGWGHGSQRPSICEHGAPGLKNSGRFIDHVWNWHWSMNVFECVVVSVRITSVLVCVRGSISLRLLLPLASHTI